MASYKVMIVASYIKLFNYLAMFIRIVISNTVINISATSTKDFQREASSIIIMPRFPT